MTFHTTELRSWPDRLDHLLSGLNGVFTRAVVLRETDSTQDAARKLGAQAGEVITTGRQTGGRGRYGRTWADTAKHGVAVTFVTTAGPPEEYAIRSAVAVALAAERLSGKSVAIKWPNDIIIGERKLAGILIEQDNTTARIGIGINVNQHTWPSELAGRAISLAEVIGEIERIEVIEQLIESVSDLFTPNWDRNGLAEAFASRDELAGRTITARIGQRTVTGVVEKIDPFVGLTLNANSQQITLPAAETTILQWR